MKYFFCYSYRLMYYIKSQGLRYIRYGFNTNNGLKYYVFERNEELDVVLKKWDKQKHNLKEENQ